MSVRDYYAEELKIFFHTNLKPSLENVFLKDKSSSENSALSKLFSNKTESLKSTAKSLLEEILLRETLDRHILNKINEDISSQKNQLNHLNNLKTHYFHEWQKELSKTKSNLENNIIHLEQEKRKEYLECWHDLMALKKYLLFTLKDFWDMQKKREVLSDNKFEFQKDEN